MLAPSLAIGWTIWRRHRYGLLFVLGYVSAAAVTTAVLPIYVTSPVGGIIAALLTMPLTYAVMYLIGIFSYGFEADLNARESCFPAGQFTLPVPTVALAGWPIAYGAVAVALLWLATAGLILQPALGALAAAGEIGRNMTVPLWWPAVLSMAVVASVQALLWSSFGLPVVRIVLAVFVIAGAIAAAQIGAFLGAAEGVLVAIFAGVAAMGYAFAYLGVRRARCGEVPEWSGLAPKVRPLKRRLSQHALPFASAAGAQVWFEWRRTGKSLPFMIALVLPFVLLPLLWGPNEALPISRTLLTALAIPVLFAGIAGTMVSGKNAWVKDYYGVAPFTATLPMTTAGMVAAKLKAAAWSTLATWTLLAIAVPLAVVLTGNWPEVAGWWQQAAEHHEPAKIIAGLTACLTLLILWTWKQLVNSLFLGLTGRKWVIQGTLIVAMAGFVFLWGFAGWIYAHPETHGTVRALLPWLLGVLALCRLAAAAWALRRGIAQRLLEARTIMRCIAAWILLASLLIGLLAWSVPANRVPFHYIVLGVVLNLPMARMASMPLALAWNRHR